MEIHRKRQLRSPPALPNTVYAPLTGEVIPIEQIGDSVFSDGILGPGIGMELAEDKVSAPLDGTITQVSDTKHAVGVTSTAELNC